MKVLICLLAVVFSLNGFADTSTIKLRVPKESHVVINGYATTAEGSFRTFKYDLERGRTFDIDVMVFWKKDGKVVRCGKDFKLTGGQTEHLIFDEPDFDAYSSTSTTAELKVDVPKDAYLFIDNNQTFTEGVERKFTIKDIVPGKTKEIAVHAWVKETDGTYGQTIRITVLAGAKISLAFNRKRFVKRTRPSSKDEQE